MEEKIVKLGVVGLGRGLLMACEALLNKNVKLCAVCDNNKIRLTDARKTLEKDKKIKDVLYFEEFSKMLEADIDAVIVATDATKHTSFSIEAIKAGKHVLSEIPTVDSLDDAKKLRETVRENPDIKYMVGENCCFWAFIEAWKKMYEENEFGEIVYAESEYLHSKQKNEYEKPSDPKHWRVIYPAIKYLTHNLGPLLYIMNDRVVSVTCIESDIKYNPYRKGPATGAALFKTAKGAIIRILICFGAYVGFDHKFRLIGTKGTIETDNTKAYNVSHSFARLSDIPESLKDRVMVEL